MVKSGAKSRNSRIVPDAAPLSNISKSCPPRFEESATEAAKAGPIISAILSAASLAPSGIFAPRKSNFPCASRSIKVVSACSSVAPNTWAPSALSMSLGITSGLAPMLVTIPAKFFNKNLTSPKSTFFCERSSALSCSAETSPIAPAIFFKRSISMPFTCTSSIIIIMASNIGLPILSALLIASGGMVPSPRSLM